MSEYVRKDSVLARLCQKQIKQIQIMRNQAWEEYTKKTNQNYECECDSYVNDEDAIERDYNKIFDVTLVMLRGFRDECLESIKHFDCCKNGGGVEFRCAIDEKIEKKNQRCGEEWSTALLYLKSYKKNNNV